MGLEEAGKIRTKVSNLITSIEKKKPSDKEEKIDESDKVIKDSKEKSLGSSKKTKDTKGTKKEGEAGKQEQDKNLSPIKSKSLIRSNLLL